MTYFFVVFGPFHGQVPLVFTASADATAEIIPSNGAATGGGAIVFRDGSSDDKTMDFCEAVNGPDPGTFKAPICVDPDTGKKIPSSFNVTFHFQVTPNHLGSVFLDAGGFASGGSFTSVIDPTISFAPGFDHTGLTLEFSPNPPGTTPEPGSLVLLGSGMTTLFCVVRRRRRAH